MKRKPQDETEEITEEDEYVNEPVRTGDKVAAAPEEIKEEADYINAPVCTVDKESAPADQRFLFFTQSLPLVAVCWLILLVIMGLRIHFTHVFSEHDAKLKTERKNLTEQLQNMETDWNELNVSRAQWTINAYCPKINNMSQCKPCQNGWIFIEPSCYEFHYVDPAFMKTWEEAREKCRGENAGLAVVRNKRQKSIVENYSGAKRAIKGYWIGLRVEDGKWKWIDGTELTQTSWIGRPTEGHCAVSIKNEGWRSVRCDVKKRWICAKKALTV